MLAPLTPPMLPLTLQHVARKRSTPTFSYSTDRDQRARNLPYDSLKIFKLRQLRTEVKVVVNEGGRVETDTARRCKEEGGESGGFGSK